MHTLFVIYMKGCRNAETAATADQATLWFPQQLNKTGPARQTVVACGGEGKGEIEGEHEGVGYVSALVECTVKCIVIL